MAGTATVTSRLEKASSQGRVQIIEVSVILDASGNLSGEAIPVKPCYLTGVEVVPGGTPPTSGFTLLLNSDNGADVLCGDGAAIDTSKATRINTSPAFCNGNLYPTASGAGANGAATLYLYVMVV